MTDGIVGVLRACVLAMLALLPGCAAFAPPPRTVEQRVAIFAAISGAETTGRYSV